MILSFDPGPSTGVAVIDSDTGALVETHVFTDPDQLRMWILKDSPWVDKNDVVAERGPDFGGHHRKETQEAEEVIKNCFPHATWVSPGQWKGHPVTRNAAKDLKGKTQHEKDALGLARWYKNVWRRRVNN